MNASETGFGSNSVIRRCRLNVRLARKRTRLGDETVGKPERYASHFERDSQNPLGFGIGIELV
jgi:hypothetical protein